MRVVLSEPAKADLLGIYEYISDAASATRAEMMIDVITASLDLLSENPAVGRRRPEFDRRGVQVRSFPEPPLIVFYAVLQSELLVVRVLHEARDVRPEWILSPEPEQ